MRTIDKIISKIVLPTISIVVVLLVFIFVISAKNTTRENNGYIRVINCVISTPATKRTQSDIEKCYTSVERDLKIHLQRYDTSAFRR